MSAKAKLFIVTMGNPAVVEHCLKQVGLDSFFTGVTDDNPKQSTVAVLGNTQFDKRLRWDQCVLIDDTAKNFMDASTPSEMVDLGLAKKAVDLFFTPSGGLGRSDKHTAFSTDRIMAGRQGFCYCLLVDPKEGGITEAQMEMLYGHCL